MKPKEFLKLQREWYQKLHDEGFRDIENKGFLKVSEGLKWSKGPGPVRAHQPSLTTFLDTLDYYLAASHFLVDWGPMFMSDTEQIVWELHCNGKTVREIAEELTHSGVRTNKDYVNRLIMDLDQIMISVLNVG